MIDLAPVATFLAVVRHGGFREAAKHTGLSQPAVSQQVKRLERSLNATLIDRSNAGSSLTDQGRTFLPYAEHLLTVFRHAQAAVEKKTIVVGASSNAGIYLLQPYFKMYKESSQQKLDVVIGNNTIIAEKLKGLEIDVAVMEWWDHSPGFSAAMWRSEELVLIVPPQHPWADLDTIPRHWLKGLTMLGGESGTGTGRLLRNYLGQDASSINVSMQLGSTEAVKHAVHAGLGVSLVMASAVRREIRDGWIRAVAIEEMPPQKEFYLIQREREAEDGPASRFIEFLRGATSS